MPNQASFWAFWKAPPHDEMVSVFLSCAAACGAASSSVVQNERNCPGRDFLVIANSRYSERTGQMHFAVTASPAVKGLWWREFAYGSTDR